MSAAAVDRVGALRGLVLAALPAGVEARAALCALAERAWRADQLEALIGAPEVADFARGVELEAAHQVERWGAEHDDAKTPGDWHSLVHWLTYKASLAMVTGDPERAAHHVIAAAAALANWHRRIRAAVPAAAPAPLLDDAGGGP